MVVIFPVHTTKRRLNKQGIDNSSELHQRTKVWGKPLPPKLRVRQADIENQDFFKQKPRS